MYIGKSYQSLYSMSSIFDTGIYNNIYHNIVCRDKLMHLSILILDFQQGTKMFL